MTTPAEQAHTWGQRLTPLSREELDKEFDKVLRFMLDNYPTEEVIRTLATLFKTYNIPAEAKRLENFDEFHNTIGQVILERTIKNIPMLPYEEVES